SRPPKKFHKGENFTPSIQQMDSKLRRLLVNSLKKQSDYEKKQISNEKTRNSKIPNNVFNNNASNNASNNVSNNVSNDASNNVSNNISNNVSIQKPTEKMDETHKKSEFSVIVNYGPQCINIECQQSATLAYLKLIAETQFSLISIENLQYRNIKGTVINIHSEDDWNVAKWEMNKENNDRIEVYIQP
ncbi:10341_t:CDS:2, partial [Dentiscutata erythropus]